MVTLFDFVTIGCLLVIASGYFTLPVRQPRTLLQLLLAAIAFAIANQLGNAGYEFFGSILIIAGLGYATMVIRQA